MTNGNGALTRVLDNEITRNSAILLALCPVRRRKPHTLSTTRRTMVMLGDSPEPRAARLVLTPALPHLRKTPISSRKFGLELVLARSVQVAPRYHHQPTVPEATTHVHQKERKLGRARRPRHGRSTTVRRMELGNARVLLIHSRRLREAHHTTPTLTTRLLIHERRDHREHNLRTRTRWVALGDVCSILRRPLVT